MSVLTTLRFIFGYFFISTSLVSNKCERASEEKAFVCYNFNMTNEFLDVISETDEVIFRETRARVHQLGLWHRGVHVLLFTADGRMLVQKRSASRAQSPSLLDCSVSEHVQAGESYAEAAVRGLREELGLENIALKKAAKFRMNYGVNDNEISELYEGEVHPGAVRFDHEEIDSIQYLSMDELKEILQSQPFRLCGWFVEILNLRLYGKGKMQILD